jgi:hypothetical protein
VCVCEWDNKKKEQYIDERERKTEKRDDHSDDSKTKKKRNRKNKKGDNGNTFTVHRKARVRIVGGLCDVDYSFL